MKFYNMNKTRGTGHWRQTGGRVGTPPADLKFTEVLPILPDNPTLKALPLYPLGLGNRAPFIIRLFPSQNCWIRHCRGRRRSQPARCWHSTDCRAGVGHTPSRPRSWDPRFPGAHTEQSFKKYFGTLLELLQNLSS